MIRKILAWPLIAAVFTGCATVEPQLPDEWLAGDHHIHSQYSVSWDGRVDPPAPRIGGHGRYPIPTNAQMAMDHGLSWMVATDHGGRMHAKIDLELAYPELLQSREDVPQVIQFFGFEMNSPGADHSSLIVPHTHDEADRVWQIESQFDKGGAGDDEPDADTTPKMVEALIAMQAFSKLPVVIANHPSRRPQDGGKFGLTSPADLRAWNDTAPNIAVGMAGAPGHQAADLNPDGSITIERDEHRGAYNRQPTFGGFDIMTAELGGFWDSMLGEGRRWWITANSDSHFNYREGGIDFWPGEYSKTYVYGQKTHDGILSSLRNGRVFVTTGDLISELYVTVENSDGELAEIGGTVAANDGEDVTVTIRLRDPAGENHRGDSPAVNRVDVIVGEISGLQDDPDHHSNPSTRVFRRFTPNDWSRDGELLAMSVTIASGQHDYYIRVRGTNTSEDEPLPDIKGDNPWDDLWFYANPVFVTID